MSTHNLCFHGDRGASNDYPQHMFSWRNKKKDLYFWADLSDAFFFIKFLHIYWPQS